MKTEHSSSNQQGLCMRIILFVLCILASLPMTAQSNDRSYIRNAIKNWGECRNVAITKYNGDIALYGRNGCARSGIPASLDRAITRLNKEGKYIDDIQLTDAGSWLIIVDDNGLEWNNIPSDLEAQLRKYNRDGQVINSVTFNDSGDWIIITNDYYCTSHSEVTKWLKDGGDRYGQLWCACITDDAMVAVYEKGYKFLGEVPDDLKRKLNSTSLNVYRLKIAGTSWFFADKNGNYDYKM